MSLADRFWAKVDTSGECWEWTAFRLPNGYGRFRVGENMMLAHRAIFLISGQSLPDDREVDHLCRNRACVRPGHLDVVTHAENNWRSDSPTAINARKTHCKRGHEFSAENTYISNGTRQCRSCRAIRRNQKAA